MHKWFFAVFILMSGLFHSADSSMQASPEGALSKLTRAEQVKEQLRKNFTLDRFKSSYEWRGVIRSAIEGANSKFGDTQGPDAETLSKEIVRVSQCYGIDPGVFSALVWRESHFRQKAVSERGAVGLTQMTQAGVHEVLDRVTIASPRRIQHLRSLVRKCNPQIFENLPMMVSADTVAAWKNNVALSHQTALSLGAILLKINLAHVKISKWESYRELYRLALEKYNGDPKVKSQFALDVLQLETQLTSTNRFALSDSKFLRSVLQF